MKVRFAVTPPSAALAGETFGKYLGHCERLGFDTLWLSDVPLGPIGDPLLSLAYAAATTGRLKLGANVVPLGRNPLLLARELAQLDRLSGGRLLLSFVPGLGQEAERAALGYARADRGRDIEAIMDLLRRWWAGESVRATFGSACYEDVSIAPLVPLQQPLEIWLGGKGPAALERAARVADGWLTAAATPAEAARGRASIERRAAALGRRIDPEHFGISLPCSHGAPDETQLASLRRRRADGDLAGVVAIGRRGLRELVCAHIGGGLSKFVLRPLDALDPAADWRADLDWLADTVLDLQS